MIASWIVYALLVSLLLGLAALVAERGLAAAGRPVRWVWVAAIGGSIALPLAAYFVIPLVPGAVDVLFAPEGVAGGTSGTGFGAVLAEPLYVAAQRGLGGLDQFILAVWAAASVVLVGSRVRSRRRLARLATDWRRRRIGRATVLHSETAGPGVCGILRSTFILPDWTRTLSGTERRLVIAHERSHAQAGDPRLLELAAIIVALVPWNLPLWWQLRRLRLAVELDCDRRVLNRGAPPGRYGSLLVDVGSRRSRSPLPAAALSEPMSFLERRIRAMNATPPRHTTLYAGAAGVVAAGLLALACEAPSPPGDDEISTAPPEPVESAEGPAGIVTPADDTAVRPPPEPSPLEELSYIPRSVDPRLENSEEVVALLRRDYPPMLKEAGIGGETTLFLLIDEQGSVTSARLKESSGYPQLDEAARAVAMQLEFSPAENADSPVSVWIVQPIEFRPENGDG